MTLRRYCLASLVAAVLGLAASDTRGAATNTASVVCPQPILAFGGVYPDAVVRHGFVLTNQGSRLVRVTKVNATCGCAKAAMSTSDIPAGKSATLDVVVDFKGRRGYLQKSIYVTTDEPGAQPLQLEIRGTVLVPIEVQPEGLHFGTVGVEGTLEREVLLNAVGTNEFTVLSVTPSSTQMTATCETLESGKRYKVRVSSEGPRAFGSTMASVRVATDNARMPQVDIPVAMYVAGDIVVVPALLLAVPSATNVVKTSSLTLYSPSGKRFKVTGIQCPGDGGMTAGVSTVTADRVRIEVKTRGPLTGIGGNALRIETDLPAMREVLVPVRVLTRDNDAPATGKP